MKKLLALVLTLTTLSAFSGEIKLFDRPQWNYGQITSFNPEFVVNNELGRVWINISFTEVNDGGLVYDERVKIEGLSFNQTTNQIQLDVEGIQIICANVKTNFFGTKIRLTGNCHFKQKNYTVNVDNGYEIEKIQRIKITLNY